MNDKKAKRSGIKDADVAFKSPTQLTASRLGNRSSPSKSDAAATHGSRRTPYSGESDPERDEIMAQMAAATGVVVRKPSDEVNEASSNEQVSSVMDFANVALASASGVVQKDASPKRPSNVNNSTMGESLPPWAGQSATVPVTNEAESISSANTGSTSKDLDMKHNDNAFHVLANLVLDRFRSRMTGNATSLDVTESDQAYLSQMLQPSVRNSFVEAVRYRLEHNCPPESQVPIHLLTRQCQELGLDREGDNNPLLANPTSEKRIITITNLKPALDKDTKSQNTFVKQSSASHNTSKDSGTASTSRGRPPPHPENTSLFTYLEEQKKQLRQQHTVGVNILDDNSVGDSTLTGSTLTGSLDVHTTTTESLARQQLMAELREASNFMADSKTPEAASFWREHVVELQARLRALHGEGGNSPPTTPKTAPSNPASAQPGNPKSANTGGEVPGTVSPNPETILESNNGNQKQVLENIYEEPPVSDPAYEPPTDRNVQSSETGSLPMVDVISPANLPGGYHFEAEIDGERFLATVPPGGVQKGETFSCIMRDLGTVGEETPVGRWRDRLSDCTAYGVFHPAFLNGLFCPLIALGQVMTRAELDWLVRPQDSSSPCCTMGTIVAFWMVMNALIFGAYNYKWSIGKELSLPDVLAIVLLNGSTLLFTIFSTAVTRQAIREKYVIREQRCYDLEDCCCGTFCMPCTICQMSRHTANYDKQKASCCTSNGLSDNFQLHMKPNEDGYAA